MTRTRSFSLAATAVCLAAVLLACQGTPAPTPTPAVTPEPSVAATETPSLAASVVPTDAPTPASTPVASLVPSLAATEAPSLAATEAPSLAAIEAPTEVPTLAPAPTAGPAATPASSPVVTPAPSPVATSAASAPASPVATDSAAPVSSPVASAAPSLRPFGAPSATPNPVPLDAPAGDGTAVRLTTDLGDIVIGLFNESAPVAAENFQNLAESGFYDGVGFHRVVPGFVIQGGDPEGTGSGGPGYTIADEEVVGEYGRGIVAMARTQQPNSQGSQFFVVLDDGAQASLDAARTYTIFGRVVEGMDVVDAIVERGPASDRIEDPVRILGASIEQVELPPEPTPGPPSAEDLAAAALVAQLPTQIAGIEMGDTTAFTAAQVLGQLPAELLAGLSAAAEAHDADPATLTVARTGGVDGDAHASVVASTITGVPGEDLLLPMARILLDLGADVVPTEQDVAGRTVSVFDLGGGQLAYGLAGDDLAWVFITDEGSLEDVVAALQ